MSTLPYVHTTLCPQRPSHKFIMLINTLTGSQESLKVIDFLNVRGAGLKDFLCFVLLIDMITEERPQGGFFLRSEVEARDFCVNSASCASRHYQADAVL